MLKKLIRREIFDISGYLHCHLNIQRSKWAEKLNN